MVAEPSTGLDPAARLFVWDRVREMHERGTTVVLTTHDMDEATALCDRVGIVDHGKLLAIGTPAELVAQLPTERVVELRVELPSGAGHSASAPVTEAEIKQALAGIDGVVQVETVAEAPAGPAGGAGGTLRLRLSVIGEAVLFVAPASERLGHLGARLAGVSLAEASLEDVFIHLTGRALR